MSQKEYFGLDSLQNIIDVIDGFSASRILLITGKKSYEISGAKKKLEKLLIDKKIAIFNDFSPNPQLTDANKGIKRYTDFNPDIIIAVGGGSVIDMAKLIGILSVQPNNPVDYITKKATIIDKPVPLVAIPTTAGSGSEATHFAVVYIDKVKYSLANKYMLPAVSIIDPSLTLTLPKKLTASTGIDALSQAIESFWCINSTEESKKYSTEAIRLVLDNLMEAYEKSSLEARTAMAKAANLAGKAINITKTTASHAMSYVFTSYFNIPHGHAVGLTLGEVLVYNSQVTQKDVNDTRGVTYVKETIKDLCTIMQCSSPTTCKQLIYALMKQLGLATHLSELNIDINEHMDFLISKINLERLKNNPRSFSLETLKKILSNIA